LIFCKEDGTPLTDHYVLRRFYKVLEQHGIRRITFQTLRHCYASYLNAVGADDKLMQTYLGHSTITITKDLYTHLMPGAAEQLMGKLDDLLAG
jgi:site-specific recombinase XerD